MNGCDFFGHSFDSVYSDEGYWGIRWSGEQEVCQGWITSLIATEGIWNVNVWQVNDAWWRLWACLIELVPLIWFTLVLCIESDATEIANNTRNGHHGHWNTPQVHKLIGWIHWSAIDSFAHYLNNNSQSLE